MKKQGNTGFTIVELIIAMAISSIVLLIINRFVFTGTKLFEKTSNDTKLQIELQQVCEHISGWLLESEKVKDAEIYGSIEAPTGLEKRYILNVSNSKAYVIIYQSSDRSLKVRTIQVELSQEEKDQIRADHPTFTQGQLEEKEIQELKQKLSLQLDRGNDSTNAIVLSKHVKDISIEYNVTTKVSKLTVLLENEGKVGSCSKQIKSRNS